MKKQLIFFTLLIYLPLCSMDDNDCCSAMRDYLESHKWKERVDALTSSQRKQLIDCIEAKKTEGKLLLGTKLAFFLLSRLEEVDGIYKSNSIKPMLSSKLLQYSSEVTVALFHPRTDRIATVARDGIVRLWDPEARTIQNFEAERLPFPFFSKPCLRSVAFDSDGTHMAAGSNGGKVHIWDVASKKMVRDVCLGLYFSPFNLARSVAFSNEGKQIVTLCELPATVSWWDARSCQKTKELSVAPTLVSVNAFELHEYQLFTAADDGIARVHDLRTDRQVQQFGDDYSMLFNTKSPLTAAIPNRQATQVVTASDSVRVWDVATGQKLYTISSEVPGFDCRSVQYNRHQDEVVTGFTDGTIQIWDCAKPVKKATAVGHEDMINSIMYNRSGNQMVTASNDRTVQVWNLERSKIE